MQSLRGKTPVYFQGYSLPSTCTSSLYTTLLSMFLSDGSPSLSFLHPTQGLQPASVMYTIPTGFKVYLLHFHLVYRATMIITRLFVCVYHTVHGMLPTLAVSPRTEPSFPSCLPQLFMRPPRLLHILLTLLAPLPRHITLMFQPHVMCVNTGSCIHRHPHAPH